MAGLLVHTCPDLLLTFLPPPCPGAGRFAGVRRLSPPGSGLSPHLAHTLSVSLISPIILYGVDLYTPHACMTCGLSSLWHQVQRWCTNCFKSTPIPILAAEASLPHLSSLVAQKQNNAAIRLACSPPHINPATARLPPDFPTFTNYSAPDTFRALAAQQRTPPNYRPLH